MPIFLTQKNFFCDGPNPLFFCTTTHTHNHATNVEIVSEGDRGRLTGIRFWRFRGKPKRAMKRASYSPLNGDNKYFDMTFLVQICIINKTFIILLLTFDIKYAIYLCI
jgi:hypothetical protein